MWTKAVHLQILCMWWHLNTERLSVLWRVAGLGPQGENSSKGEQSDLHAQMLPLVSSNTVKTFAFGLSSELKLSVTKGIFISCSSNAHSDILQEFSNPYSATIIVKLLYLKHPFRMISAISAAFRQMYPCNHQQVDNLPFTVSHISYSLPKQKVHKKTLVFSSLLSI